MEMPPVSRGMGGKVAAPLGHAWHSATEGVYCKHVADLFFIVYCSVCVSSLNNKSARMMVCNEFVRFSVTASLLRRR